MTSTSTSGQLAFAAVIDEKHIVIKFGPTEAKAD